MDDGVDGEPELVLLLLLLVVVKDHVLFARTADLPGVEVEENLHVGVPRLEQDTIIEFELALVDGSEVINTLHLDLVLPWHVEQVVDIDPLMVIVDHFLLVNQH